MNDDLVVEDFATLIEALQAWESKHIGGEILGTLIEGVFLRGASTEVIEKHQADTPVKMEKNDRERQMRCETSVIIQAKLIRLRDRLSIEGVTK